MLALFDPLKNLSPFTHPLKRLRKDITARGLAGVIITREDNYANSFLHPKNEFLERLSGFSGSAGIALITEHKAGLFTDGRYLVQAQKELKKGWECFALSSAMLTKFAKPIPKNSKLGFDGFCLSAIQTSYFKRLFKHLKLEAFKKPLLGYYHRNKLFSNQLFGGDLRQKLDAIKKILVRQGADRLLIDDPALVAWLFDIRSDGVAFSPLPAARCIVSKKGDIQVFAPRACHRSWRKVMGQSLTGRKLTGQKTTEQWLMDENAISAFLTKDAVLVDKSAPHNLWHSVRFKKQAGNSIKLLKAIKTDAELAHITAAHIREGSYITLLLHQLEQGSFGDEIQVVAGLAKIRKTDPLYWGDSFATISAFGANSALPHYIPKPTAYARFEGENAYMLDCGAHYLDGTTDLTRTLWLGKNPPASFKRHYTLVLKAHINLARTKFRTSPKASQLDAKARKVLLKHNLNYPHSTGHGVGNFLAVHEAPPSVAQNQSHLVKPNMVFSNEPAVYLKNKYGIRLENLVTLARGGTSSAVGEVAAKTKSLSPQTLSLVPFETRLINKSLLTQTELRWLNEYHQRVCQNLYALLPADTAKWLELKTATI